MYLSQRYLINPLETLRLDCGQFGYLELKNYKLLHCPWTVFLFIYLVVCFVNFFKNATRPIVLSQCLMFNVNHS